MRVHELAKELGISSKDLISDLNKLGIEAKNHMSNLDGVAIQRIRDTFQKLPVVEKKTTGVKPEPPPPPVKIEVISEKIETPPEKIEAASEKIEPPVEQTTEGNEKVVTITLPVIVKEFAHLLGVPINQFLAKMMDLGEMIHQNASIDDQDLISLLGAEFGFEIHYEEPKPVLIPESEPVEESEKPVHLVPRAPVVTFMGHVDHGKTSLLDQIRKSKVVEKESGGITQHIGAYQVSLEKGKITFLDTPGHEAFTLMRARGAQITDLVVLVIAADDGFMPQTVEALSHCKSAHVPVIVAINKMDKPNVSAEKVKRQLSEKGLLTEDWGGQTIACEVSAKTGIGIDHLLEMILLQAEIMELKADPTLRGRGIVVESKLESGKGPTATVLIRQGTVNVGDAVICGTAYGKIKALFNDHGKMIRAAGPSTPVEILGLSEAPVVGVEIKVVKNEKLARQMAEIKIEQMRLSSELQPKKMTLEDVFLKISNASIKEFRLILKSDVRGSLEAVQSCLSNVKSDKIDIKLIHEAVGDISENDVMLASASHAVIIGFHVRATGSVRDLAKKEGVEIRLYSIIYEIADDVKKALEGMLEPIENAVVVGHAQIRKVYDLSKYGKVAGCAVTDGKVMRSSKVKLLRNGEPLFEGTLQSLKRFKDEVKEVREGFECGIRLSDFNEIEEGDTLEFFEIQKTAQKL